MSATEALGRRLAAHVGRAPEGGGVARDPVNAAMIRHWCDAMGDTNPIYLEHEAARVAGHPGVVAPPTMLQAWTMRGLAPQAVRPTAASRVFALLDEAGFTSVVATDCNQSYDRYLNLGDLLREQVLVESVSGEKRTALGPGHFVTTRREYFDQRGERVASMTFRLLKFRPTAPPGTPGPRPEPVTTLDTEFFFTALAQGRLVTQRCTGCGALRHPPAPICPTCGEEGWEVIETAGRGVVYSFVVVHHPRPPGFRYPLVVALVELEEGIRVVAEVEGSDPADVRIGLPVELQRRADNPELPSFRPERTM